MNKKFENLGIELSRNESKNIIGSYTGLPEENKCNVSCTSNSGCDTTCPNCEKGSWGETKYCVK